MKTLLSISILLFLAAGSVPAQDKQAAALKDESALVANTVINVESIQCGSCVRTVEKALKAVGGVETAKVDLKKKTATVTYRSGEITVAQLEDAITKSGYSANDKKADPAAYEKLDDCCKVAEE